MAQREVTRLDGHAVSTPGLIKAIASDTSELLRKEVQLARQEIVESVPSMLRAAAGGVIAAAFGAVALIVAAFAVRDALSTGMKLWAADLVTMGILLALAGGAALQIRAVRRVAGVPEETKRTLKEDVEWAKHQLKR
ncbi:MAG: phage holin family protein [Actinomycetota bacterium]